MQIIILKLIWSFMITTTGLDFEAHNTPHALMEEKFMQDFPYHLISFFLKILSLTHYTV